jgi:hypothetical protein
MSIAKEKGHADEFSSESRILDDFGAPNLKPNDPQCQPQYKRNTDAMDRKSQKSLQCTCCTMKHYSSMIVHLLTLISLRFYKFCQIP